MTRNARPENLGTFTSTQNGVGVSPTSATNAKAFAHTGSAGSRLRANHAAAAAVAVVPHKVGAWGAVATDATACPVDTVRPCGAGVAA